MNVTASTILTRWIETPLGPLEIALIDGQYFQYFEFKQTEQLTDRTNSDKHELLDLAEQQLREYFSGKRKTFSELFSHISDRGTEFQRQCWQALISIPYGDTWTYGQQAKFLNKPSASRAVGAANGKNPLAVVVPCHRVIGANGSLTGYAGGLDKKQWLLEFEQKQKSFDL